MTCLSAMSTKKLVSELPCSSSPTIFDISPISTGSGSALKIPTVPTEISEIN